MRSTRIIAVAAGILLAALVASAVALAAAGSSPATVTVENLTVGPGPPTTATGVLDYSSSTGISAHADCAFDFAGEAADVTGTISLSIVTVPVEARLAMDTFYLHLPQFASLVGAPWVSTGQLGGPTRLDELAELMRRPDLSELHATRRVTVTSATGTTTTLSFGLVHLPSTSGLPFSLPHTARVTASVLTGTQGQLLHAAVLLVSPSETDKLTFEVTGYDVPVVVTAPDPSDVVVLSSAKEREIFGTNARGIASLLGGLRHVLRAGGRAARGPGSAAGVPDRLDARRARRGRR